MSIDIGSNLYRGKHSIGLDLINKITTKLQRLGVNIEDYAVRHWVTYSPLVDLHNTEVVALESDVDSTDIGEDATGFGMVKLIPETVYPYELVHGTVGGGSFTFPYSGRKFGGGVQTDGAINITIDDHADLDVTDVLSFGGFIYPKAFTGAEQVILIKDQQYKLVINAAANTLEASVYIAGSWGNAVTYSYTANTWIDVWVVWDGTDLKLYINGVLQDTEGRAGALNTTANDLGILGTPAGGSRAASGTMLLYWSAFNDDVSSVANWLTNHNAGILDTTSLTEIFTISFMDTINPTPNATLGLCLCGP